MKTKFKIIFTVLISMQLLSCVDDSDLDVKENNVLSAENINPEQLVIAAYSALDYRYNTGEFRDLWPFDHAPSNWATSDIRCGDAYKGGGGTGDNPGGGMHQLETHDLFPSSENAYNVWRAIYFGIKRVDSALRTITATDEASFPNKNIRIGELKVLRAHFYFEAIKNFGSIVWYDENTPIDQINKIPNSFDASFMWSKVEGDLNAAIALLPDTQEDLGRVNKVVAYAFLCKAQVFQKKWPEAVISANYVIGKQYGLVTDIEKLYSIPGYANRENIFAVQYSINDGSQYGNLNFGNLLNAPDSPGDDVNNPYLNGDDFDKPSQNLVNAYKVGPDGLPLFDTFNNSNVTSTDLVDPRLDHAIGRTGITWKDWTARPQQLDWNRDPATYGNFLVKKNVISPKSSGLASNPTGFPWALGNLDFPIIKYSDLLLWKAEALIESGSDISGGIALINEIRNRAKLSPYVKDFNNPNVNAANYLINLYPLNLSQDVARKALRMERRLELANEGHGFYDLVRWGIAEQYVSNYIQVEKTRRSYLQSASLQAHEQYLPIPQIEIDASSNVYKQRIGY
ncbi:RagB/SusD family nutrient uptake outer membrane protein [Flavobacterium sp. UMI-01]|uniref:RagB/SusD family nutrient uptake outer membrane protein n=1 Tax=Flavobacterium sp. UMI-01 TaxID=1441053 RepID=UPI001C7DBE18|nr:RagB/SusD family nutrient uptake outer membrane protein [Flavobacterium sp. UMI-01]